MFIISNSLHGATYACIAGHVGTGGSNAAIAQAASRAIGATLEVSRATKSGHAVGKSVHVWLLNDISEIHVWLKNDKSWINVWLDP